jgi:indolepyruvate ferredoxin oxidoreductase beta subunit
MSDRVVNVIVAGLGGQGVLRASDILADAAFRTGRDVKKSEVHGMSQRGGSVTSGVRFGRQVLSPMVPEGEADFLVVLAADQVDVNRHSLAAGGLLIAPDAVDESALPNKRCLNVALLGVLSRRLDIDASCWQEAIRAAFADKLAEMNLQAFDMGRAAADNPQGERR